MVTETFLPEIRYIILNHVLEHTLGRGLLEQLHRVGEVVFVTEGTNSGKPVPFTLTGVSKEVVGNIVEDIAGELEFVHLPLSHSYLVERVQKLPLVLFLFSCG